jgi:membrane-bound lytic murein transglycosylase D
MPMLIRSITLVIALAMLGACANVPSPRENSRHTARAHHKHTHLSHRTNRTGQDITDTQPETAAPAPAKPDEHGIATQSHMPAITDYSQYSTDYENTSTAQETASFEPADDSFWRDIQASLRLQNKQHPRIEQAMRPYVRNPKRFVEIVRNALPYLHWVAEEAKKHGMPGEVALLPFIESGFNPKAYSPRGAAGMWQFTAGTGALYGLKRNTWYDGRLDVYASTQAAMRYLTALHQELGGSWELALAAYNTGPRLIQARLGRKAITSNIDIWALPLPSETYSHMARIYAFSKLVAHSKKYGITLPSLSSTQQLTQINLGKPTRLADAAKAMGIATKQLQSLNPGYRKGATGPQGPHHLLVPQQYANALQSRLANLPLSDTKVDLTESEKRPLTTKASTTHKVKSGDTLWKLAQNYGVNVKDLLRWNKLKSRAQLKPGQKIYVQDPAA